jgi:acetyl/propionyl-CoA carboxylase alpha subunit
MSSGFVSGGTVEQPTERDDEWRQAQKELEEARKAKADLAAQHDGKSLFEILQANKDKKQADFEERARYKLHVSLDDDEADYLDSIEEKKRKEEAKVRKETLEQLDVFRRQREEAESKALEEQVIDVPGDVEVQWAAPGRKRKKGNELGFLKGMKLRKTSSATEEKRKVEEGTLQNKEFYASTIKEPVAGAKAKDTTMSLEQPPSMKDQPSSAATLVKPAKLLSLGLGYASSDEDD